MAAQMTPRFRDLPDVNWPSFADGEVATYDTGTDTITGETVAAGGGGDVTQQDLQDHADDGSFVHGIVDTSNLATDTELTAHSVDTTVVHGIADTANIILAGDSRLSDSRTPSGAAGGVLSGNFPNPGFAADMATQAELDAVAAAGADLSDAVVLEPDTEGRNVIQPSDDVTALTLKGDPGQTTPIQAWTDSGDALVAWLSVNGRTFAVEVDPFDAAASGVYLTADPAGGTYIGVYGPDGGATGLANWLALWSDSTNRHEVDFNGAHKWSNGTDAVDTTLERTGPGVLEVNGEPVVLDDDARLTGGVDQGDIDSTVATHSADTTSVHGITDTAVLATDTEVATAVSDHSADTTAVHGIADTSALASLPIAEANVTGLTAALAAKQPVDSDLTALAALSTTSYGRSLLELADAAAGRTALSAASTTHASAHADGGADEIVTALDPLTFPNALKLDRAYVTGQYYPATVTPHGGLGGAGAQTVARAMYTQFIVYTTTTFDRIAVYITVNAGAGGLYRLGIYNDNAGVPGTVLLDAGTVATDAGAAAIKSITISQQLTPGRYWACSVAQVAAATVRRTIGMSWGGYMTTDFNGASYYLDGVTGALGNNPAIAQAAINPTMVGLRALSSP